jgi:hypothetical protein
VNYFLLGPSGVGKTRFGDWLEAERKYHHMRVDNGDQDSELGKEPTLLKLWMQGNPKSPFETSPSFIELAEPFSNELQKCAQANGKKNGCVLTFWSYIVFAPSEIDALAKHNIVVKYLYGPKEKCIDAAFSRDAAKWSHDKDRARAHWCEHNKTYQRMGGPGLSSYRADVFKPSGDRLSPEEIVARLAID